MLKTIPNTPNKKTPARFNIESIANLDLSGIVFDIVNYQTPHEAFYIAIRGALAAWIHQVKKIKWILSFSKIAPDDTSFSGKNA